MSVDKGSILTRMGNISDVKVGPMPESLFLKPLRMTFKQEGKPRLWDLMKLHNSVSIIIFNSSRNVLVLVKQFRPAVYFTSVVDSNAENKFDVIKDGAAIDWSKHPASNGFTLELCAGIMDHAKLSPAEIGKQEVLEECGYDVPLANLEFITCYRHGVGVAGNRASLFYAEVTDDMKVSEGGGNVVEGELIQVVEMTIPEVRNYMSQGDVNSPGGFLFGIMWFLAHKAPKS